MIKTPDTNMNLAHDKGGISSQWINDGSNIIGGNTKVKYLQTELPVLLNLNNDLEELLVIIVKKEKGKKP